MNNMIKNGFLFTLSLLITGMLFSQTAINISGTQVVKKGETFTIESGQTVVFEPGATLQIEGSLLIKGTSESPVVVKSSDPSMPGNGFMIVGIDETSTVAISHVKFQNLIQPMRFDPFWYRKSVKISNISISGSNSGEPMIYVAGPFLDLRDGMDIDFQLIGSKFYNNTGNILLEKVGSDGISYSLDGLTFNENALPGDDRSMGVLHLDFANSIDASNVKLGEFAFNRNTSGTSEVGLSISGGNGTGSEKIAVAGIYSESNVVNVVLDRRSDSRLPSLEVNKLGSLSEYSQQKDFILSGNHKFGKIELKVIGNPVVVKVEDSLGNPVYNNATRINDTLELIYLEGNPTKLTLADGQTFEIPKLTKDQLPPPIYRKIDTVLLERIVNMKDKSTVKRLTLNVAIPIPMSGNQSQIDSRQNWELGQWFGGAIYAGGDIKHKFSPMPSTVEYSYGAFIQKNVLPRFSTSLEYNYCKISMHNLLAPGLFSAGKVPEVLNVEGFSSSVFGSTYQLMFVTPIHSIGINGLWHLSDYDLAVGQKSKWISTLGAGVGGLYFTPYRLPGYSRMYDGKQKMYTESMTDYRKRVTDEKVNLRKLGTEGQNVLPGMKRYSALSTFVNLSYRLTYYRNRFSISGEFKATLAHTDYLDDFGPGLYYGGNRELVLQYAQDNLDYTDKQIIRSLPMSNSLNGTAAQKSTNGLPDGFYQMHMGIAYHLNKEEAKRLNDFKVLRQNFAILETPTIENWNNKGLAKIDSGRMRNYPGFIKTVEVGTWVGSGMYVGDIKPKFAPMPSSMEISMGLFMQLNYSPKHSWKLSYYNTGISSRNAVAPLLLSSVKLPEILDNAGNQVVFQDFWMNFNSKLNIIDLDYVYTTGSKGYLVRPGKKRAVRQHLGCGLGIGDYQVYKSLEYGSTQMIDLRKYGMEGERFSGSKNKFSNYFGLFNGSYGLSYLKNRWTIKGEIKAAITTSDKLDGYSNGLWFGGDIDKWYASTDESPNAAGVKVNSLKLKEQYEDMVSAGMDPVEQRAKNKMPDGYIQFHLGLSYRF